MKKILIALALLASGTTTQAQLSVGGAGRGSKISEKELKEIQATTTLFVVQDRDMQIKDVWEKAIGAAWKVTPFKVISDNELKAYLSKPGYSFFEFAAELVEHRNSKGMVTSTTVHLSYDFFIPSFDKKGELKTRKSGELKDETYYGRIYLYPDNKTMFHLRDNVGGRSGNARVDKYLHQQALIYNWTPGMMKGYLSVISKGLMAREAQSPYDEFTNEDGLKPLKRDTLYIPDYILVKFNPFTGDEKDDEKDDESTRKAYKYPHKVISVDELDKLLLDDTRSIFYVSYLKNSAQKVVNVFNSKTGMEYANTTPMSYNFKNKDLAKIAKRID